MVARMWLRGLVTCAVIALCALPAPAQKAGETPGSWDKLIASLEKDDFIVGEGTSIHFDPIGKYCAGKFPNALYANYGAPYAAGAVPASPRLNGIPDVENPPIAPVFRLAPDEAVVFVGTTPPRETYFSYQIYLAIRQFSDESGHELLLNSLGDTVNIHTINTIGPDPFERPMVMIFTPDRGVDARIRAALRRAGYPASIINTIVVPSATLKLGLNPDSDIFLIANRNAIFVDKEAGAAYVAHPTFRVLRLTPEEEAVLDPFPTPPLRVRGTGQTEIDLTPTLDRLRQAILDTYDSDSGYSATEYITAPMGNEGFDFTQRQLLTLGDTRDSLYLGAGNMPEFGLHDELTLADGEFLIAYGLDHVATGKATYINVNSYDSGPSKLALGSAFPADLKESAYQYLSASDPAGKLTYAYKISRHCEPDEPFCLPLAVPDGCRGGTVVLDETTSLGVAFRLYLEPPTSVGPAYPEIVYDRIIKFSPVE